MKVQVSDLEEEMKQVQYMILNAEKKRMMDEIADEIDVFDKDLTRCQGEKNMLESEMTISKMKLLTQYQELMVLGDMEE